jgi:hypothetical protein
VLQRRLDIGGPTDGKKFVQISVKQLVNARISVEGASPALGFNSVQSAFPRPYMEALLQLYADLGIEGLASPDLSLPNVYFSPKGGVTAGILDVDHVVQLAQRLPPSADKTWNWIARINSKMSLRMPSVTIDGRVPVDASTFMEKVLEMPMGGNRLNSFIELDGRSLEFQSRLIDVSLIPKYFKNFKIKVEEIKAKKGARATPWLPWLKSPQDVFALLAGNVGMQPALAY